MNDDRRGSACSWAVEHASGPAALLHGRDLPEPTRRSLWWFDVTRPAVVLGSTQPESTVDAVAADAGGYHIVRRRSGGGAVLLRPGEVTWLDVIVPAGDPLWEVDVGRAFHWLGEVWRAAAARLGVEADVHRGPLVAAPWSSLVCFAGLGPGEVTVAGAKLVGVAQRRTRDGARFQCALHHRWRPGDLAGLLNLAPDERAALAGDLAGAAVAWDVDRARLREAVEAALPD